MFKKEKSKTSYEQKNVLDLSEDVSYDAIICLSMLQDSNIPEISKLMNKLNKLLNKNGKLLIDTEVLIDSKNELLNNCVVEIF